MQFPEPFKHEHPPVHNVNQIVQGQTSWGQQFADSVAGIMGSWKFIIIQTAVLVVWIILNALAWIEHWDPYPFTLMNFVLAVEAAYAAPIIMMSQNRQAVRDRLEAHHDYAINQKAEDEVRAILNHLAAQDKALILIHQMLQEVRAEISQNGRDSSEA